MPKVERITFDDDSGDWWEIRGFLSVALEREFVQHAVDAQETFTNDDPELIVNLAKRMDDMVVKSTVAWSYGPVSLEILYSEVPGYHYADVAKRIGDLYSPLVVQSIERGLESYSLLLSQREEQFP